VSNGSGRAAKENAQRIFKEENIPFHDLGPYFKTLRDKRGDFIIPHDGHPNEAGLLF